METTKIVKLPTEIHVVTPKVRAIEVSVPHMLT